MLHGKVKVFSTPGAQRRICLCGEAHRIRNAYVFNVHLGFAVLLAGSSPEWVVSAPLCSLINLQKIATTSLRPSAHTAPFFRVASAWEEMGLRVFPFHPKLAL